MNPTADYLARAQDVIHQVFLAARPELITAHGQIDETIKSDNTPVTELDKRLETELRAALKQFDPGVGFEGEEHGKEGDSDTFWLIDPIDGTESFVRGLPMVRNMATLISGGEPVYAYVYNPITNELYTATKGQGAFRDGTRLTGSQRSLRRCWLELAAQLDNPKSFNLTRALLPLINGYRMLGDFPLVAEGKIDGMVVYQSKGGPWDYAPRALLFQEAGLRVTNFGSERYDFRDRDWLAIHESAFEQLMPVIVQAIQE